ncbi:MAG: polysaccharide biosynthesis/export family protein [Sphingobium sp.]
MVNIDAHLLPRLKVQPSPGFSEIFGNGVTGSPAIGPGDVLEVTIWEAPPAVLFGMTARPTGAETGRSTSLPEFLVSQSGVISIPFVGVVQVAGRPLPDIEREIVARLRGKAHLPQVMVRLLRNETANVTVVGEVARSLRMPLTPKGEHLLDAIAAAGGTKQEVDKVTVQIVRNGVAQSMPLQAVISDSRHNVALRSEDVVTVMYQPYRFTVLGAAGRTGEVPFEGTGLTLAQAMGRANGLQDGRADAKGVFLFRWEDPAVLGGQPEGGFVRDDGRVPVIYRVNMKDPATLFIMQEFAVRNEDILYVSNSPAADMQRFISLVASTIFPIISIENAVSRN